MDMAAHDIRPEVIWTILWDTMEGGSHDLAVLRALAHDDAHFIDDLGLDSLDMLEFYLRLDEAFELNLAADDYPGLNSVQAIMAFLEAREAAA
jgi:acyl carrier protein